MARWPVPILACLSLLAGMPAHAGDDELLIETSLAADGALLLRYTPPAGVRTLPLWDRSAAARDFWREQIRPLDDCATLEPDLIRLRDEPRCTSAALRVEPKLLSRVATYEAAQPISATGVLAYSGFYAVALTGHALHWRWLAPHGGYVLQGGRVQRQAADLRVDAATVARALEQDHDAAESSSLLGARQYAYLGKAPLIDVPGGVLLRDPALDDARTELIRGTLTRAMRDLTMAYGAAPVGPVGVVASTSDLGGFNGDVSDDRMMRLRVSRQAGERDGGSALQQFVTHEAVHWWNMGLRHSDAGRPWLHEGNADWATLLILSAHQVYDVTTAEALTEAVLNRCLLTRGDNPAASLPPGYSRQDDPYSCGFALMLMAQAQQQARRPAGDTRSPLALLASLYTPGTTLDMPRFAAWADGSGAGPMHELLFATDRPFASSYVQALQTLGLAKPLPFDDAASPVRAQLAGRILMTLMHLDCGTASFSTSYGRDFGFFKLSANGPACASLRRGGEVTAVAGQPLIDHPLAAWDAAVAACSDGRPLTVGYRQGGVTQMSCPPAPGLPPVPVRQLLRLKPDAWQRLGLNQVTTK